MKERDQHDLRAPLARAKTAAKILAALPETRGEAAAETCQLLIDALNELEQRLADLGAG